MAKKKKNRKAALAVSSVLALVVAVAAVFVAARWYVDNRMPNFTDSCELFVYPDTPVTEVMDSLVSSAGALRAGSLKRCFAKESVAENIKPGHYFVDKSCSSIYVARMLTHAWQTPVNMVLSGTLRTKGRIAQRIGSQMMVDSAAIAGALCDDGFLDRFGFDSEDVFGLIIPDSYQMYWTASVEEIFARFRREYDAFWTEERLSLAKAQGLSPKQVSTMASIVNGETLKEFEYPIIAGVYLNRYHKGMKLQADPTIAFCHGYTLNRILLKHLEIDSPYNTYKHAGLPPAPISCPPKGCLEAVLKPQQHDYIFFCASPEFNGTHRFAVTYSEHLKNAREFQTALTIRQKARAAEQRKQL